MISVQQFPLHTMCYNTYVTLSLWEAIQCVSHTDSDRIENKRHAFYLTLLTFNQLHSNLVGATLDYLRSMQHHPVCETSTTIS